MAAPPTQTFSFALVNVKFYLDARIVRSCGQNMAQRVPVQLPNVTVMSSLEPANVCLRSARTHKFSQ